MRWFRAKSDPIAASQRALDARIASLQNQIRELNNKLAQQPTAPAPGTDSRARADVHRAAWRADPGFEPIPSKPIPPSEIPNRQAGYFNELGVRKYDLMAVLRRWIAQWRGTPAANPKLVNYLAAGSIHGLRPLRYERRIARRRFLAGCVFLLAVFWWLIYTYLRSR